MLNPNYTKVGRLKQPIAKEISRKAAYIYVDDYHLKHIENKHQHELSSVGLDAFNFVKLVVGGFNQIRKGSGNSILLVIYNGKPKVVAIELNYSIKKGFYEVKTATIMSKKSIERKDLLIKL